MKLSIFLSFILLVHVSQASKGKTYEDKVEEFRKEDGITYSNNGQIVHEHGKNEAPPLVHTENTSTKDVIIVPKSVTSVLNKLKVPLPPKTENKDIKTPPLGIKPSVQKGNKKDLPILPK